MLSAQSEKIFLVTEETSEPGCLVGAADLYLLRCDRFGIQALRLSAGWPSTILIKRGQDCDVDLIDLDCGHVIHRNHAGPRRVCVGSSETFLPV